MRVISPCPADSPAQPLSLDSSGLSIRVDAALVEKTVLLAIDGAGVEQRQRFHAARDPIYETDPGGERERSFQALHAAWFQDLGLAEPLVALFAEQPSICPATAACLVVSAKRRKDQHADLRKEANAGSGRPTLVIQLCPETLVDPPLLDRLLVRELCYVADMLDLTFGYDPDLAVERTSGPLANILRERHDLLWSIVIEARLSRTARVAEAELERLRHRFQSTFAMLGPSLERVFRDLVEGPRPTHQFLLELAVHPLGKDRGPSGECPACSMPVPKEHLSGILSDATIRGARADFPHWLPEHGLCLHCADLYDLRERAGRV